MQKTEIKPPFKSLQAINKFTKQMKYITNISKQSTENNNKRLTKSQITQGHQYWNNHQNTKNISTNKYQTPRLLEQISTIHIINKYF